MGMDPTIHALGYVAATLMLVYQVRRWASIVATEEDEQERDV